MLHLERWIVLFAFAVFLVSPAASAAPPDVGAGGSAQPAKLLYLPFFTPGGLLQEQGIATFDRWVDETLEDVEDQFPAFGIEALSRDDMPASLVEDLAKVRGSRQGRELLDPLCKTHSTDGVLAFWLERAGDKNFRMVSLLYLPSRLALMSDRISLNLERELVGLNANGKFHEIGTKNAARAVLERGLSRIVDPADPARDEVNAPGADPRPNAGSPGTEIDAPDTASPSGTSTEPEETVEPPLRVGVIELSHDFVESAAEIEGSFSQDALDFRLLQSRNLQALGSLPEIKKASALRKIEPWTYDEVEAPPLDMDPNADPKAKEKVLAEYADDRDGLIFGHLRQHKGPRGKLQTSLYLRLFLKDTLQIHTETSRWLQARGTKELREIVLKTTRRAFANAFPETDRSKGPIWILPRPREGLERIARRCYRDAKGKKLGRLIEQLARRNNLSNPDRIRMDQRIEIPHELAGLERKDSDCR